MQAGDSGMGAVVMEGPYAGADLELGRRGSGAVAIVAGTLELALFAFAPPTHGLGVAGWTVGVVIGLATLAGGASLLRPGATTTFGRLAVLQWSGLAGLAILIPLTGGADSPQVALTLLWMVNFAALHPTTQFALSVLAASAMTAAPLIYGDASLALAGEVLARLVVWIFMAVIAHAFMAGVRRDRLARERDSRRAAKLARLDPLTGLGNRRAFDETLRSAVEDARAEARPLSVVVADVHNFKDVNDRFGHLAGDACLRSVATALAGETRRTEPTYRTYRWGGDEFAVLLPDARQADADLVAARLVAAVEQVCAAPDGGPLQLACGSAELEPAMTAESLLDAADLSLTSRRGDHTGLRAADAG